MENQRPYKPHDKFFKAFMKLHDVAEDLLRGTLPPSLQDLLRLGKLTPYKADFLSPEWKEAFADVTYRIQLPEGVQVDVLVLFEHKSYLPSPSAGAEDKPILLQLLEYIVGVWEADYKQKAGYQLLLPVIFYHGRKPWPYDELTEELFGRALQQESETAPLLQELRRFQPSFDYILINLHEFDDDKIIDTFHEGKLRASLMVMRDYATGQPASRIPRYISNLQEVKITDLSLSFVRDLANYILALGPENEERTIMEKIKEETYKIHPSDEPGFVSALDAMNRRQEKAIEEAAYQQKIEIAKNLKGSGFDVKVISANTGLSEDIIRGL